MSEPDGPETAGQAERRFIEDLIARGEAVPEGTEPPSNATHEIVEERDGVPTKVRRRRFSLSDDLGLAEPEPKRAANPEPAAAPQIAAVFFDPGRHARLSNPVAAADPPSRLRGLRLHRARPRRAAPTRPAAGRHLQLRRRRREGGRRGSRARRYPRLFRAVAADLQPRRRAAEGIAKDLSPGCGAGRRAAYTGARSSARTPPNGPSPQQAGNRTVPHPLLVVDVLDGQKLQRIRVSVSAGPEVANWQAILRQHRVVPLRVSGTDAPVIEALAAERAAAQLASPRLPRGGPGSGVMTQRRSGGATRRLVVSPLRGSSREG